MRHRRCAIAITGIVVITDDDTEQPEAAPAPPPADEPVWVRNRRIRNAELENANARGAELAERYGYTDTTPRYALVSRRRRRRR